MTQYCKTLVQYQKLISRRSKRPAETLHLMRVYPTHWNPVTVSKKRQQPKTVLEPWREEPHHSFNLSDGSQITECWTLGSYLSTKKSSLLGLGAPVAKPLHSQCRVRSQVWSLVGELDPTCHAETKSLHAAQPPPTAPTKKERMVLLKD